MCLQVGVMSWSWRAVCLQVGVTSWRVEGMQVDYQSSSRFGDDQYLLTSRLGELGSKASAHEATQNDF